MKAMNQWMRALVAGVVLMGCIEPMDAVSEQDYGYTGTMLATTPPAAIAYSRSLDTAALWQSASARRIVHVVAYTLPRDASGAYPLPRFRAFGMDMAARSYLFTVDGERTSMGEFNDRMLVHNAVVIITPPGFNYPGSCPPSDDSTDAGTGTVRAAQMAEDTTDAGTDIMCGTKPVQQIPVTGGVGGNDWWFNWGSFMDMAMALNGILPVSRYSAQ